MTRVLTIEKSSGGVPKRRKEKSRREDPCGSGLRSHHFSGGMNHTVISNQFFLLHRPVFAIPPFLVTLDFYFPLEPRRP